MSLNLASFPYPINNILDPDPMAINVRTFASYKVKKEIQDNCNLRVMRAYSLYADSPSLSYPNKICPKLEDNCCGPNDIETIEKLWRKTSSRIQKYQSLFLLMVKYILTQFQDWQRLATNILKVSKQYRRERTKADNAGQDFVWSYKSMKILINSDIIELSELIANQALSAVQIRIMYDDFNQAAEFMVNVRRHFYCMVCSVRGQEALQRSGNILRQFWSSVLYDQEACPMFALHHLLYFHSYIKFFKRLQRFIEFLPYFIVIQDVRRARVLRTRVLETELEYPSMAQLNMRRRRGRRVRVLGGDREETENRAQEMLKPEKPPNPNGFDIQRVSSEQVSQQQNGKEKGSSQT